MPKKKKTNPNRIPMTEADVRKAWGMGADFGITFCLKAFLFVLKDKHNAPDEDVLRLKDEFEEIVDAYNRKDIKDKDLDDVLATDFDLHIRLT